MVFIIGIAVLGALIGLAIAITENGSVADRSIRAFFGIIIVGLLGVLAGMGVALLVGLFQPTTWKVDYKVSLVAMDNLNGLHGSFFLASGTIRNTTYYSYWYVDGGAYRHGEKSDSDNIEVYEDATKETAYLQLDHFTCKTGDLTLWSICTEGRWKYEFHVPEGSIVRDFKLH